MGNENISDVEIFEALKIAQLYDTVIDMPNGLDTIVGKHGIRLSGGQRQRLSIARMIIANPSVVIFDEATANLDHNNATRIEHLLLSDPNITYITVTHHLIKENEPYFDKIIRLGEATE